VWVRAYCTVQTPANEQPKLRAASPRERLRGRAAEEWRFSRTGSPSADGQRERKARKEQQQQGLGQHEKSKEK